MQKREYDTGGWQCFHTPETIREELVAERYRMHRIEKIYFDTPMEMQEINIVYGINSSFPIHEYLLTAQK